MRFEFFGIRMDLSTAKQRAQRRPRAHTVKPKPEREASEFFWTSFCGCGTIVATCSCGRTHFAADTTMDYGEGELEGLLAKAKACPDKYCGDYNNDSVSVIDMPDGLIVWGCPCHKAARYENFLLDYRRQILEFYRHVIADEEAAAKQSREALTVAQGNV